MDNFSIPPSNVRAFFLVNIFGFCKFVSMFLLPNSVAMLRSDNESLEEQSEELLLFSTDSNDNKFNDSVIQ